MKPIKLEAEDIKQLIKNGFIKTEKEIITYKKDTKEKTIIFYSFLCLFTFSIFFMLYLINSYSAICFIYDWVSASCYNHLAKNALKIWSVYMMGLLTAYNLNDYLRR